MIMVGKVIVSLVWAFWVMAMSAAEGQEVKMRPHEQIEEKLKLEFEIDEIVGVNTVDKLIEMIKKKMK